MSTESPVKVFTFVPDSSASDFDWLPFPKEGDVIWIGDDKGTVVNCGLSHEARNKFDAEHEKDEPGRRYETIVLRVKI